ncbi:glycerophosphodiester phosphodiesterase [Natronobacterium gregoryi]|uniref:Glycerophosphodiester phosphodiesterase n=2 Tax=Natronobacterium gregoryi TaxID=44930 RepID=L0AJ93_NATGS|nr:glycerophosphodiester phosphodiesterase [Natronobacterium gregoryi]AFZ73519.1 glycerophosphoryl diester phosphodiesterase [Natronobacterium gregoryi SP2]ELY68375.1 glycerophosphoryl diester phosphodiesterase [Natronobacterium gregoryi SP2]PLK20578.1 glycerophosphodiester phosphodiesterase [Natronobacterium gregoryi SP2]SFJ16766.1 glycerophosphoryl diester phosphodiesterase [Natronobacterium gregoryi]
MSEPDVIAHRGYAGVAPENTVRAVREATARDETAMVEIDVQPAACGTPVVIHDECLEGSRDRDGRPLTDAEGIVWETPLEVLQSARVLGTAETVPTLADVLEAVPETAGVNVELKNPGAADRRFGESLGDDERDARRAIWQPFVERVIDVCAGFDGELLFSSFYEGALAAVRDVAPRYCAAALVWDDLEAGLEIARRHDCEAVHPPRNAIAGTPLAETEYAGIGVGEPEIDVLEAAHAEGRTVNVWTVERWTQYADLAAVGVDGVIMEYPGLRARFRD